MEKCGINKSASLSNILKNNINNITATYNLPLQKKFKMVEKSCQIL